VFRRVTSATWSRVFLVRGPTISSRRPRCVLVSACWTLPAGIVARTAARRLGVGGYVVGVDPSVPMLTVARTAAAAEDLAVEWREGSAAELPIADASFDVAFCQQGLQFLPERPPVLRKMYRVLATGGRLVLSVPGLSRARGSANAARQSRGGHADDRWAIRSSADDHARAELLARVNAKLQSHIDDQGLAFPIESNIVIARR